MKTVDQSKDDLIDENRALKQELSRLAAAPGQQGQQPTAVHGVQGESGVLKALMESSGYSVFSLDRNYRYTSFTRTHADTMKALYGVDIELGHKIEDYQTVKEDWTHAKTNLERALEGYDVTDTADSGNPLLCQNLFEVSHYPIRNADHEITGVSVFSRNVTKRKRDEHVRSLLAEVLNILLRPLPISEIFDKVVASIKHALQFDSVGIQIRSDESHPYAAQSVLSESPRQDDRLHLKNECILVVSGKTDPSDPHFTAGGSYWANDPSVALVPIRQNRSVVGLLQLSDNKRDRLSLDLLARLEEIASLIGAALLRRSAEESLRESEELWNQIMCHSPVHIYVKETSATQSRVLKASENFRDLIGIPGSEMVGKTMEQLFPAELAAQMTTDDMSVVAHGKVVNIDEELNGRKFTSVKFPILLDGRSLLAGFTIDITERKQAEEHLYSMTQRLKLATESAQLGVWDWDVKNNVMVWDERMLELYGLTKDTFPGGVEAWQNGLHPLDRERTIEECQAALRGEKVWDTVFRVLHPNGTVRHIKANGVVLHDDKGAPLRMLGVNSDITERKALDDSLRLKQELLATTGKMAKIGGWSIDVKTQSLTWTEEVCRIHEVDANFQPTIEKAMAFYNPTSLPVIENAVRQAIEMGESFDTELQIFTALGNARWIRAIGHAESMQGEIVSVSGAFQDITERKNAEERHLQLEEQLRQTQKMEAVGQLAGGVAHDFNNMLTGILGNADLLRQNVTDPSSQKCADTIVRLAQRSGELTKQLLAFARKGKFQKVPVDMHKVIGETCSMLQHTLDRRISVVQHLEAGQNHVLGDPAQLQSALLNLAVNARDAMVEGGTLTFSTNIMNPSLDGGSDALGLQLGRCMLVSITDTGVGMEPTTVSRIFEPFFTTKGIGKGTGLGLASVYGVVKSHDGNITVKSAPGQGTTFRIFLPLLDRPIDDEHGPLPKSDKATGRVMVVDDEEDIRTLLVTILETSGYSVTACANGREALEAYRTNPADLVVLDLIMPVMNGRETFQKLKALNPSIKVLVSSGYSDETTSQTMFSEGALGFLHKPYDIDGLLRKVAEVLALRQ